MDQRYEKRWQRSCPQKADSTPPVTCCFRAAEVSPRAHRWGTQIAVEEMFTRLRCSATWPTLSTLTIRRAKIRR